ncbi:hypothetical protein QBC46DRAFT_438173, partial [Diplogelasinospora grovesii]
MAKLAHMSVRSRYRMLFLTISILFVYFFAPRQDSSNFSISAASVIQWSAHLGRLPPSQNAGSNPTPMAPPNLLSQDPLESEFYSWRGPDYVPRPKPPYKPPSPLRSSPPIPDPFPLLSSNPPPKRSLLQAPKINRPPKTHYPEQTPLLIGFTRNWPQLLQCVVSYIAAGWPPEDIFVVENTGVMNSNKDGKLSLQNPFYLNHTQLDMLGVDVIITPTLLTFAQLQNFYAWTALEKDWETYFWSHQDLLVFSFEDEAFLPPATSSGTPNPEPNPEYAGSLYTRCVSTLRYLMNSLNLGQGGKKWASHFFAYDHLTLVNRDAILAVGGWDTHIPYYAGDCDMYNRLRWAGYGQGQTEVGFIFDVATVLEDVGVLLLRIRNNTPEGEVDWQTLVDLAQQMEDLKYTGGAGGDRNTWQMRQSGGRGEPFYRDPEGFETGLRMLIDTGRAVFAEKWGHRGCDIAQVGITAEDEWRLERDWDVQSEGFGWEGDLW